jgi:hypothetical protein
VHPPRHLDAWPDGDRRTRIVFITRGIEREAVEASLLAFNALGRPVSSRTTRACRAGTSAASRPRASP